MTNDNTPVHDEFETAAIDFLTIAAQHLPPQHDDTEENEPR